MIVFNGPLEATLRKERLREEIKKYPQLIIFALIFQEDTPSMLYTNMKKKDAESIGIAYEMEVVPIATPVEKIKEAVQHAVARKDITGIIVQKPGKDLMPTPAWWHEILTPLAPEKDVDGLTPNSKVLPATARGILTILDIAKAQLQMELEGKIAVVIGRSEIVGAPVARELEAQGMQVYSWGRKEFAEQVALLKTADVVVTATGQPDLVHAKMLKPGVIAIDAGSPKPEITVAGMDSVARFLSTVPGGVGPMTRVCLLENLLDLVQST